MTGGKKDPQRTRDKHRYYLRGFCKVSKHLRMTQPGTTLQLQSFLVDRTCYDRIGLALEGKIDGLSDGGHSRPGCQGLRLAWNHILNVSRSHIDHIDPPGLMGRARRASDAVDGAFEPKVLRDTAENPGLPDHDRTTNRGKMAFR